MRTLIARFPSPIVCAAAILLALTAAPANASAIINVNQVGPDVVFTLSGSLDLTGATFVTTYPSYGLGFIDGGSNWYVATGNGVNIQGYALTSYAGPFGTNTSYFSSPTSSTGDNFFIWGHGGSDPRQVGLPVGYVSGTPLSAEMIFAASTIAGFSMTPGTYLYTLPSDVITLNIGGSSTPVPEPTTLLLVAGGLVAALRRRRQASAEQSL